ncbi:MAG: VOC family protein [Trueperaceae bacterium]|jgi:catechol 2,3-dioxygenase-like lactoylglutathione lyase family enzyme|nr:VOC family protein [Trueperaceae bacterium]
MHDALTPTGFVAFRPVEDLAASRDFYVRDLGLTVARDQGACLVLRVAERAYLGLCQRGYDGHDGVPPGEDRAITTLLVEDVAAAHDRLRRLGVEVDGPPRHHPTFAITHFFARDPDGHRVEIQRFDEPLP